MIINQSELEKIIIEKGFLTASKLQEVKEKQKTSKADLEQFLISENIIKEKDLYKTIAQNIGFDFVDLENTEIKKEVLAIIPEPLAREHKIIAFESDPKTLKIAMSDPTDLETSESIKKKTGKKIVSYLATNSGINFALKLYKQSLKSEFEDILSEVSKVQRVEGADKSLEEIAQDIPVIKIVDSILEHAILEDASDIHIEPLDLELVVRYRVDGILKDVMTLPKQTLRAIIARIKVLSNLKIDEQRLPQDGRFKKESSDYKVSFRVSTIPVFGGEKVVLRILKEGTQILTLEQLGFQHSALEIIKNAIQKPHGMVLVTGPTGSGKTTTLYSVLNVLNTTGVNIATIEDPVEYHMPRINQTQVHPQIGLTFAKGLRSLLRQDPDIIMVGEIRDNETAEIAIHSALTGHIVLSTLHTNNAAGAAPRLLDMEVEPYLASSTINVIVGQRLVRRICPKCIESYSPDAKTLKEIQQHYDLNTVVETMKKEKLIPEKAGINNLKFFRGKGCANCHNKGFKGRIGIYEVLEVTPTIQELIEQRASTEKIEKKATEEGMITMLNDGFIKSATGVTTIEEVLRVTQD